MSLYSAKFTREKPSIKFNDASPCFCSAAENQWENMRAHAPYTRPGQALARHALSCSEEPTVLLGKDFVTRANKPEQTQRVKGAQLEVVTHYTTQGNQACARTKVVQNQLW